MMKFKPFIFLLFFSFTCLSSYDVLAEAPVVDDSENFVLLEEEQAAFEPPVARTQININDSDEEPALATDILEAPNKNNNALLLDKIQGLQQEVQELRGQLEVQTHDLKLLQQQQLAFYKDLDARLHNDALQAAKNESSVPDDKNQQAFAIPEPTKSRSLENTSVRKERRNPADEQISYLAAYELVKNKRYDDALTAMQTFVTQYPQSGYTANAEYWLGELHMVKQNYPKAIEHFEAVVKQFPSSSKSAASMLKLGYALAASGKKNEAKQFLQQVIKNYPDTHTAQLATVKLNSLGF